MDCHLSGGLLPRHDLVNRRVFVGATLCAVLVVELGAFGGGIKIEYQRADTDETNIALAAQEVSFFHQLVRGIDQGEIALLGQRIVLPDGISVFEGREDRASSEVITLREFDAIVAIPIREGFTFSLIDLLGTVINIEGLADASLVIDAQSHRDGQI